MLECYFKLNLYELLFKLNTLLSFWYINMFCEEYDATVVGDVYYRTVINRVVSNSNKATHPIN